jgi:hypothetical protein
LRDRNPESRARRRRRAPDDQRTREAALEQADAAQDQRAHDALAELGFSRRARRAASETDHERFDRQQRSRVDERRAAGELVQLADERPGPCVTIGSSRPSALCW